MLSTQWLASCLDTVAFDYGLVYCTDYPKELILADNIYNPNESVFAFGILLACLTSLLA